MPKESYLAAMSKKSTDVLIVKVADRTDNLRGLVRQPDAEFARRHVAETQRFFPELLGRLPVPLRLEFDDALEQTRAHWQIT